MTCRLVHHWHVSSTDARSGESIANMADTFISYAREDIDFVRRLVEVLHA